jgi:hypothetical protein
MLANVGTHLLPYLQTQFLHQIPKLLVWGSKFERRIEKTFEMIALLLLVPETREKIWDILVNTPYQSKYLPDISKVRPMKFPPKELSIVFSKCTSIDKIFDTMVKLPDYIQTELDFKLFHFGTEELKELYFPSQRSAYSFDFRNPPAFFFLPQFLPTVQECITATFAQGDSTLLENICYFHGKFKELVPHVPEFSLLMLSFFDPQHKTFDEKHFIYYWQTMKAFQSGPKPQFSELEVEGLIKKAHTWIDSQPWEEVKKNSAHQFLQVHQINNFPMEEWANDAVNLIQFSRFDKELMGIWMAQKRGKPLLPGDKNFLQKLENNFEKWKFYSFEKSQILLSLTAHPKEVSRSFILYLMAGYKWETSVYSEAIILAKCSFLFSFDGQMLWDKTLIQHFPPIEKHFVMNLFSLQLRDENGLPKYKEAGWWKIPVEILILILKFCYQCGYGECQKYYKRNIPIPLLFQFYNTCGISISTYYKCLIVHQITRTEWEKLSQVEKNNEGTPVPKRVSNLPPTKPYKEKKCICM